jgi:hypothetical protein
MNQLKERLTLKSPRRNLPAVRQTEETTRKVLGVVGKKGACKRRSLFRGQKKPPISKQIPITIRIDQLASAKMSA